MAAGRVVAVAVSVSTIVLTAMVGEGTAGAQPTEDDAALELAERYSPIVVVRDQEEPCDTDGEPFAPMSVDLVLDNDDVTLRQAGAADPVVRRAPVAADLFSRGEGFFLDLNGLALEPGCVYERDYDVYRRGTDPVVYAHVATQDGIDDRLVVQYWTYWYFNDWNNTHESDWESIQVVFEASSVEEALTREPIEVGYAQHEGGERAAWTSDKLRRDGTHPVVHASAGSHASYFNAQLYLGRRGTEGVGCDTALGPSTELRPEVVLLPDSVDDPDDPLAWLAFEGRWGERHSGPFDGPTGPMRKKRWTEPITWQDGLRDTSVVVPGGADNNSTLVTTFCDVVAFGSEQVRLAKVSPVRPLVLLGAGLLVVRWLARRTRWSGVPAIPLRQPRRTGQMIRGAVTSYWHSQGAILTVALFYVPAAIIVGAVGRFVSFPAGQTVAGFLTTVMFILSSALISAFWHLASKRRRAVVEAPSLVWRRLPALLATLIEAAIVVVGLALTVVGIPFAIRQFVRYQFVTPVTITEGLSGREALARSSELVRGRWWWTALTLVVFGALAFALNSALQLILLFALSGVPLWAYLSLAFLVVGVVVPLLATPPILLYGDAASGRGRLDGQHGRDVVDVRDGRDGRDRRDGREVEDDREVEDGRDTGDGRTTTDSDGDGGRPERVDGDEGRTATT